MNNDAYEIKHYTLAGASGEQTHFIHSNQVNLYGVYTQQSAGSFAPFAATLKLVSSASGCGGSRTLPARQSVCVYWWCATVLPDNFSIVLHGNLHANWLTLNSLKH